MNPRRRAAGDLRQAQLAALALPNVGFTTAADTGDWSNIHPPGSVRGVRRSNRRVARARRRMARVSRRLSSLTVPNVRAPPPTPLHAQELCVWASSSQAEQPPWLLRTIVVEACKQQTVVVHAQADRTSP